MGATTAYTPDALYKKIKRYTPYFRASGGGVTFGGGEPLLRAEFIKDFRAICGDAWKICVETSLSVPWENVSLASECVDKFYVDCKDTSPEIYRNYTGKDNAIVLENLEKLIKKVGPERVVVRLPLIPEFNTDEDREKSKKLLSEIGVLNFDLFNYVIKH